MKLSKIWSMMMLSAAACGLVACSDNNDEVDMIWDFAPISLYVEVQDKAGNDLLNPDTEGSIAHQGIKVTVRGKTYEKDSLANDILHSRAYLAVFTGMQTRQKSDGTFYLEIGEFFGDDNVENETAIIDWNDGTKDTLSFSNNLTWPSKNEPAIDRHFYLNGKENGQEAFLFTK